MSKLYDVAKQAVLDAPSLLEPEEAMIWREVPCRHSRIRRAWDILRGRDHPDTHADPLIRVALKEAAVPNGWTLTYRQDGIFKLDDEEPE